MPLKGDLVPRIRIWQNLFPITFHDCLAPVSDCFRARFGRFVYSEGIVSWVAVPYRRRCRHLCPRCNPAVESGSILDRYSLLPLFFLARANRVYKILHSVVALRESCKSSIVAPCAVAPDFVRPKECIHPRIEPNSNRWWSPSTDDTSGNPA
jgi:hypothetical protein